MYNNQPKRTIDFNTEPILSEIDNIVKDGLTKLLGQYLNRYQLLERTHEAIMNLPSVLDELSNRTVSYNFPPLIGGRQNEKNEMIEKDLQAMISANENLLARVDILSKENEELTYELRELKKQLFKDTIDLSFDEVHVKVETLVPVKHVTIDSVEKENIRLEIEENDVPEDEEDEDADEEEDVEEIPAGTKLGGKTWDGDDWETDDEYEDVEEEQTDEADEQVDEEEEEQTDDVEEEQVDEADEQVDEADEQVDEEDEQVDEEDEQVDEEQDEADEADVVEEEDVQEEEVKEDDVETEKSDSEEEQDEEEDIFEIDIDDVTYCTNNEENGFIYELKDGEMGDKIGYFKEGEPFFYADEN